MVAGLLLLVGGEVVPIDGELSVGILFPVERIPSRMLNRRHPGLCRFGCAAVAVPDGGVGRCLASQNPVPRQGRDGSRVGFLRKFSQCENAKFRIAKAKCLAKFRIFRIFAKCEKCEISQFRRNFGENAKFRIAKFCEISQNFIIMSHIK